MKRIFGSTLLPMLGAIALVGACQLEEPASSELAGDVSVAPDLAPEVASDVAASTMQPASSCNSNKDCKDGDGKTVDWCDPDYECEHQYRWKCKDEDSYCKKDKDCKDGDYDTKEWCYKKKCHYADRETGECEDEDDDDDED